MLTANTTDANIRKYLLPTLIVIPFVALVYWLVNFSVDIPFWDQWRTADLLSKKELFLKDIWQQHNEHRIFFSTLIMLVFAYFSHWNIYWEITCNVILATLCFVVIYKQLTNLEKHLAYNFPPIIWFVVSLLFFSMSQNENWLWGFQIAWFLISLTVLQGFSFLVYWKNTLSNKHFIMAILCGVIASYSAAHGLVYWIAAPLFIFNLSKRHMPYIIIWGIIFLCVTVIYFYGYTSPPHTSGVGYGLQRFVRVLKYVAVFIGSPLAAYSVTLSIVIGAAGIIMFINSFYDQYKNNLLKDGAISFFFMMGTYAIINAIIIGIARSEISTMQALSSRYINISTMFWIALIAINATRIPLSYTDRAKWYIGIFSILFFAFASYYVGVRDAKNGFMMRTIARNHIIEHAINDLDDEILKTVFLAPEYIKGLLPFLADNKLSLFREK